MVDKQSTVGESQKNVLLQPEAGDVLTRFEFFTSELRVFSLALALDQSRIKKVKLNADWSMLRARYQKEK